MSVSDVLGQYRLLARCNTLWNRNLRTVIEKPRSGDDRLIDHIYRTLQHKLAADEIWISRLNGSNPTLTSLEPKVAVQCVDEFWFQRARLDENIEKTILTFRGANLQEIRCYRDFRGHFQKDTLAICVARLFNHQQHHQWRILYCPDQTASVRALGSLGLAENTVSTDPNWDC